MNEHTTPYKITGDGCPNCSSTDAIKGLDDSFYCNSCEQEIPDSQIEER